MNFISKLIEKVVAIQLKEHLEINNLSNRHQSAYKSGHSTETALLNIKNDIHTSLSYGKPVALVLLDLSAAFDTIDHKLLIDRLKHCFGFGGKILQWFHSYISQRKQAVKIHDTLSESKNLDFGVPQGSVLGPLLFTLYTSPLNKLISTYKNIKHHLYADDTQVYIKLTPENASSKIGELQNCLSDIKTWMTNNKLKLNPDKTEFMLFGSPSQRKTLQSIFPVNILGNMISPVESAKNLGVIFDAEFNFSKHVSAVCSSCYYHIRDFSRIRKHLSKSTATVLANALVSSRLDYCNSLLLGVSSANLKRLQSVQNVLCRIVTCCEKFSHITPHLKDLHWLPISSRIEFKTNLLTYKALKTNKPPYLKAYLNQFQSSYNTRRTNKDLNTLATFGFSNKVHTSSKHLHSSFEYIAPHMWNALPINIRNSPSISCFRSRLKTFLFHKAYAP